MEETEEKSNENKFFALAKEAGIEAADITVDESSSLSVSIYHSNVDSLTNNSSFELVARGIYKGKMGSVSVDHVDKNSPELLVKEIKRSASLIRLSYASNFFSISSKICTFSWMFSAKSTLQNTFFL